MITVKNLILLLNDGLLKLSEMVNTGFSFGGILSSALSVVESELSNDIENRTEILNRKVLLLEAQRRNGAYTRNIKHFKSMEAIEELKTLVRSVEILKNGKVKVNLSLVEGSVINETILETSVSLRIGNTTKQALFFLAI